MKALLNLKSAINQSKLFGAVALVVLYPGILPGIVHAADQTSGQSAQIFQIKISDSASIQNQKSIVSGLTFDSVIQTDPLNAYVQAYLQDHGSPFQTYTNTLLSCQDWKRVLAISFVESNMGIHHYYYNSSGIGGQEYLRKYNNYGEWMTDMCNLLQKRYSDKTLEQMNGIYVQPASGNWLRGSTKILNELNDLEAKAIEQRAVLAANVTKGDQEKLATIIQ